MDKLIHFAFGSDKLNPNLQYSKLLNFILQYRRLKISKNEEFIPVPTKPNGILLNPNHFTLNWNGHISQVMPKTYSKKFGDYAFLPHPVRMICFIKCKLNSKEMHHHSIRYGKMGLIFKEEFLQQNGLKKVAYYTNNDIAKDPLLKEYWALSRNTKPEDANRLKELAKEICLTRKPALQYEDFRSEASTVISVSDGQISLYQYDRYEDGYDFRRENEYRIPFTTPDEYMYFEEQDLLGITVPNHKIAKKLSEYLVGWTKRPEVIIF
ncbi:hypothetical protein [Legionella tucsonensis]|uniref:Uncharacterized protein n=1 Tax=Legionella tucsonensis TaxID=40335 RepID=A0A0W0ZRM8_9GAMM|nr:hypothetical protein [Legionella tucsonensis]KTD71529.1 hypothetical protein Ltuc_2511 [Legionella tucsonensis]